jgi:oxygen-independent coproporphyrinogen III oxidase
MKTLSELINKYNRPGPRYTSYPPVPFWKDAPDEKKWISHIQALYDEQKGVDLYVHVPYCESLCYYCGCSRTITRNHDVEEVYLEIVLKEWELYKEKLEFTPVVNSLHFGGGTPTFLSPLNLDKLIKALLQKKVKAFVGSIEIDPRTCQLEHLKVLHENGITRLSLGIQDFDPIVQQTINRNQPPKMVEALVAKIRENNFSSLNFDLIYGLPKQTLASIGNTMKIVNKMKPDLIAFYSYAHLPERIKNQRLIADEDLPSPELKRELYEYGKKLLIENGYEDVGMDHFALPSSYLFKAKTSHTLHRNFMGYVDKKSDILIGLGPTSISDSSLSFVQNAKDVKIYEKMVKQNRLPIEKGHTHSKNDLLVQDIILELMCNNHVSLGPLTDIPYWNNIQEELDCLQQDGILKLSGDQLSINDLGKGFVRNVAMCFDFHLREQKTATKFSQTI